MSHPRSTGALTAPELAALAEHSIREILAMQAPSGAFPASPSFSAYVGYSWFRDGAFIADAVSAWGEEQAASRFHGWCSRVLVERSDQIARIATAAAHGDPVPAAQMLATRFTLDGREGDDEWWDFQLDGYGTWLWALMQHADRHGIDPSRWASAIDLAVDYLVSSWSRPCFDWWEEHAEQVHVSTLGCIAAGLRAVVPVLDATRAARAVDAADAIVALILDRGVVDGHLAKWLGSTAVDASLASLVHPLALFPASTAIGRATLDAVETQLCVDGGVHRYLEDTFFGGGQWPLLTCFLGLGRASAGETERARELLEWAASTATGADELPEQVDRHLLFPDRKQEWVERWGPSSVPLLWSQAMYARLALELGVAR